MVAILFIFTSADTVLTGAPTGYFLSEAAHPYYVLSPHFQIDFASPKGPNPPLYLGSRKMFGEDKQCEEFLKDETVKAKFANAKKLSEVSADAYDVVFYVGGHGASIDLPTDEASIKLASDFYNAGKLTAAICHGTAALANVKDPQGKSIFVDKRFTGFSNSEERIIDRVKAVPFLLEDKISALGGKYEKADCEWGIKVVVDGHLYTGQNPASAGPLAKEILRALQK